MNAVCRDLGPLRDAFADGQIGEEEAERIRLHLSDCADCRKDLRMRAGLRQAVGRVHLPTPPAELRARIMAALNRADRAATARRWLRWSPAAAAVLVVLFGLLLIRPVEAKVPGVIRHSSDFHDRLLNGIVRPRNISDPAALRAYFRQELGIDVAVPTLGCDMDGGCICVLPEARGAAPWIVYRRGTDLLSLLVVPDRGEPLPATARRTYRGVEYSAFAVGENTVLACRSGASCHIWIARMPEARLLEAALSTPEGQGAFTGRRITVAGLTCRACCSLVEERARAIEGVDDARVDMTSMELVLSGENLDLDRILKALREAGYDATPRH